MKGKILIADDEINICEVLKDILNSSGYDPIVAHNGKEAKKLTKEEMPDIILCDLRLPDIDGLELLRYFKEKYFDIPVIIMTGYASVDSAVAAMKIGAENYLKKPFHVNELMIVIDKAMETHNLRKENRKLQEILYNKESFYGIVANSKKMKDIFTLIQKVSQTDVTVLIQGESGTGKELVAKAIHDNSNRKNLPFIPINCSGLPTELLESELFGYKKGAFTGATKDKDGLFVVANGGTLFLDEIADTPLAIQAKLLRVLQEGTFIPLGDTVPRKVDVRIISASNKDLEEEVRKGNFREDLFYRLNVVRIDIPPLRERKEDILLLMEYFLQKFKQKHKRDIKGIDSKAKMMLIRYLWPGNVRELENAMEQAVTLCNDDMITVNDLPAKILRNKTYKKKEIEGFLPLIEARKRFEREYLLDLLKITNGNITKAAQIAGIARQNIHMKIRQYGIKKEEIYLYNK